MMLMLLDGGSEVGFWALVISSLVGLIGQFMKYRADAARDERQHKFALEDRSTAATVRAALMQGLDDNREQTARLGDKADAAFNVANHVNEKIARLASAALDEDRATERASTDSVRSDIRRLSQLLPHKPVE